MESIKRILWATVLILMVWPGMARDDNLTPSKCRDERQLGIDACKTVIFGRPPSSACCQVIRVGHFECACPVIDPKLASVVTVKGAIKLLTACGRSVPHKFQCGSLYFP